jgi:hypothetical protein
VIALHILASKNPRVTALPTTKFIPDVPLRATARALRLSDVALMVLRVAVVMLVGVAFARPEVTRGRRAVGRVVMVDRSRATGATAAADSATKYLRDGDIAIVFDSTATRLSGNNSVAQAIARSDATPNRGSISAALAAGMRAASALRGEADSVELVLISGLAWDELDAATSAIRSAWPGRVRVVRVDAPAATQVAKIFRDVRSSAFDDPLRASLAFAEHLDTGRVQTDSVRIDRGGLESADTTWTHSGRTLVRWPAVLDSSGFPRRARADTASAVVLNDGANRIVVVAPFARTVDPLPGRVVARWADGSPAATERRMENGCARDVAIPLPRTGDLALRESTRRLVAALSAPCSRIAQFEPASDSVLAQLRGTGSLVATRSLAARAAPRNHLTTWLLVAALALLLVEPLLRRQRASA